MRKTIATLHRLLGLGLGLIFLVVCATGTLLVFEEELTDYLDSPMIVSTTAPITADALVESVKTQLKPGERIVRISLPLGKVRLQSEGEKRIAFFDPNSGKFLGEGNAFMGTVLNLHRNLLLGQNGRWLTLLSALGILFLTLSGLKLWWPTSRGKIRQGFTIKTTASRRRLMLDLHRVGGVLVVLPLFLIALTGLNFSKVSDTIKDVVLSATNSRPSPKVRIAAPSTGAPTISLEEARTLAQTAFPGVTLTAIDPPKEAKDPLVIRFHHDGQPGSFGRSTVEIDPYTAKILRTTNANELPAGQQMVSVWALPLHAGHAFGLPQQLVWLLVSILGVTLPLTGFWLWFTKRGRPQRDAT